MVRRPLRSTRTDTLFPTRRSSDLVVLAPRHLDLVFGVEEPADLLERLGGHDQIGLAAARRGGGDVHPGEPVPVGGHHAHPLGARLPEHARSEEHTSELQSLMRNSYAVFCLKKKTQLTSTKD